MSSATPDAIVVGSGPNGLAAAVTLARAGLGVEVLEAEDTIGGGARTADLGLAPGVVHDICSAVHPMALASPFLRAFGLRERGVEFGVPEASYAHALDVHDRPSGVIAWRDIERTAAGLGADGPAWTRLLRPLADDVDPWLAVALGDKRSLDPPTLTPRGLVLAARFGLTVGALGTPAWNLPLSTVEGRALLAGVAAHVIGPVRSLAAAGSAVMLAALAHAGGWPVPVGGSQAITDALARDLADHGGVIRTARPVTGPQDLPPARTVLLDTTAEAAADLLGPRLTPARARALRRLGHRTAAAKVDFVLSGPVPWANPLMGRAGTVHVAGSREQMARAEQQVMRGRLPDEPVVLVSDPAVADPSREVSGLRPLWAYAHVPLDCPVDPAELVRRRIEHFAPGFTDLVVAERGIPASRMHEHNRSLVGGDIALGTVNIARMVARPTAAPDPYRLTEDAYLCSAATPPGPGVHGLCGWQAARRVLRARFGITRTPPLAP